ncbi:uncharacterized protein [Rutidosis leptorrhynchoides]|uniref:uncharacterized protein n=1 Tax=Rutidosis leptorrhynchoides TaxID=125765 RepID=UPI003A9924E4
MATKDIRPHSRRSKSSSFSDTISDDSSVTTATPDSTPLRYLGIPFSWEQVPGIAKKNNHKKTDSSQNLLPLPPSGNIIHSSPTKNNYNTNRSFRKDPFFAALVECSKDKDFENGGFKKSSSNERTGFVVSLYSSCKRTCVVSDSIVYRRRSGTDFF